MSPKLIGWSAYETIYMPVFNLRHGQVEPVLAWQVRTHTLQACVRGHWIEFFIDSQPAGIRYGLESESEPRLFAYFDKAKEEWVPWDGPWKTFSLGGDDGEAWKAIAREVVDSYDVIMVMGT